MTEEVERRGRKIKRAQLPKEALEWSEFDGLPKANAGCRCGGSWDTHAKFIGGINKVIPQDPCPNCGSKLNINRLSNAPERFST